MGEEAGRGDWVRRESTVEARQGGNRRGTADFPGQNEKMGEFPLGLDRSDHIQHISEEKKLKNSCPTHFSSGRINETLRTVFFSSFWKCEGQMVYFIPLQLLTVFL